MNRENFLNIFSKKSCKIKKFFKKLKNYYSTFQFPDLKMNFTHKINYKMAEYKDESISSDNEPISISDDDDLDGITDELVIN